MVLGGRRGCVQLATHPTPRPDAGPRAAAASGADLAPCKAWLDYAAGASSVASRLAEGREVLSGLRPQGRRPRGAHHHGDRTAVTFRV